MSVTYIESALVKGMRIDDKAPLNNYASVLLGEKIPTRYWLQYGASNRWRRVWCVCYGNVGSLYIVVNGVDLYLDTNTEYDLEALRDSR